MIHTYTFLGQRQLRVLVKPLPRTFRHLVTLVDPVPALTDSLEYRMV
jgi:hypothetical protein